MARPRVTFRVIVSGGPHIGENLKDKIKLAYNEWISEVYPVIVAEAPRYAGPDPRRTPGFMAGHLKIMWTTSEWGRVKTIGVPGGSIKGTPAYHAWCAVASLHSGWLGPFPRFPLQSKFMTFPLKTGERVRNPRLLAPPPGKPEDPKTWIITPFAFQKKQITTNPWAARILMSRRDHLESLIIERGLELRRLKVAYPRA